MRKILSICVCLALVLVGGLTFAACGKKAETFKVKDEEGLTKAVKNAKSGDTIKLTDDVKLTKGLSISKKVTIDLNGHKVTEDVTYDNTDRTKMSMFLLEKGANVTVKGDAKSLVTTDDLYIFTLVGTTKTDSKLTVKGGTYTADCSVIYVASAGTATVEGGIYAVTTPANVGYTLNILDSVRDKAAIVVKGGTFTGFNPAEAHEGANSTYVAEGYEATQSTTLPGSWTVAKKAK